MVSFEDNTEQRYLLESCLFIFHKMQNKTRKTLALNSTRQLCETGKLSETANYVNMPTM